MTPRTGDHLESGSIAFMFFSGAQAATVEAVAERIFPADAHGGGARDANVIIYIDRAVAGYGRYLQSLYRRGMTGLNRYAGELYSGRSFVELSSLEQDRLLEHLAGWLFAADDGEERERPDDWSLLAEFFGAVRLHTLEGMFCDPMYGGNRNCIGWKLIGFPGAQWGYSAEQMKLGFDAATMPIKTLADLRRERAVGGSAEGVGRS
jgi:gluconate 2-dehydrogenase gamma chain